jgi:chaperonin GroES
MMSSFVFRPLDDRVLVHEIEAANVSSGGIMLPENAKEKTGKGRVLEVGPGRWNEQGTIRMPVDVSVGDVVLFSVHAGSPVPGETGLRVLRAVEILGVVNVPGTVRAKGDAGRDPKFVSHGYNEGKG